MPDWTYQPIFKPVLFRLPPRQARDLTLGVTGGLANLPLGTKILDFMGDMKPHPAVGVEAGGVEAGGIDASGVEAGGGGASGGEAIGLWFASRVGVAPGLLFDEGSIVAFSKFGVGHIEVGPVTVSPVVAPDLNIIRDEKSHSITYKNVPENPGMKLVRKAVDNARERISPGISGVRLGVRISNTPGKTIEDAANELLELVKNFSFSGDFITIDTRWWNVDWPTAQIADMLAALYKELKDRNNILLFLNVRLDISDEHFGVAVNAARDGHLDGICVGGGLSELGDVRIFGHPCKERSLALTKRLASESLNKPILASGGIIEPQDALDFLDAGATMVQVHAGYVFSGPGLTKRINECIPYRRKNLLAFTSSGTPQPPATPATATKWSDGWVGFALVATGLIISASTVIAVGLNRVLLPYDEAFLGVKIVDIHTINPNLMKFMSHDRVTLGGTSLSGAVLFLCLAIFGVRARSKWAYVAEVCGITAGFLAFFLYLGFKYFDPLHALVCILVLPFFIWGVAKKPKFAPEVTGNLHNDSAWKKSQIGQLMFVMIGAGLLLAGITIAFVGCSTIFVNEDLMFMNTTREHLASHQHLLPLIAHDRASFGGCLWAVGTVEMLTSMYGYRQGNKWVWWTLCLGGLPGFIAVLGIHFGIGYTHFVHLLPAYIAVVMYFVGLYCSYDYLGGGD